MRIGQAELHVIGEGHGPPLLFVPSHINHGYILAIDEEYSLATKLANMGHSVYILEWNAPQEQECNFGMDEYCSQRLLPIVQHLYHKHGRLILAGYCMGGMTSIAFALLYKEYIRALVTIATPWNFHTPDFLYSPPSDTIISRLEKITLGGVVPASVISMMMQWPHVNYINRKLIAHGDKVDAGLFNKVETWAIDGISMSWPMFLCCMQFWLRDNSAYLGNWQVHGQTINPTQLQIPSFSAIATMDTIVPPTSALPLTHALPNNHLVQSPTGHLGLLLSRSHGIARELAGWVAGVV